MIKRYLYSTIAVIILALSLTIVIQRGCYNRKLRTLSAELNKKEQIAESRLKKIDSLRTIVTVKLEKVYITTKEILHHNDTIINTEIHYVPIESNFRIEIDTLGRVDLIYRKWGTCFFPKVSMDILPSGITFGLSARLIYIRQWGIEAGIGVYPIIGIKAGFDYRLPKFSNMTV